MKVVISGGTGLIGSALIDSLVADGHSVVVLSRAAAMKRDMFDGSVTVAQWNGRDLGPWAEHVDGADAVVNLAGESIAGSNYLPDRWTESKKQRILQSRLNAGKVLVEAVEAAAARPAVFVQASAIGYYGSTGSQIITEQASAGNDFLALVSEEWEASTAPVEAMGLRRAVARIGLVLSTEEGALRRLLLPARLFAGGWFGSGKQWWSWVHIADTVSALRFLLEQNSAQGAFNVTAPNPVTNKEFGRVLGTVLNRPSLLPVPAFALNLALGEVATTVLDGQRVVPERLLEQGFSFAYPQLEGALRNLIDGERIGGQAPARQTAG